MWIIWYSNEQVKPSEAVENQEATLVLEIARAQRDVHHAERELAECMVREHEKIADLHRFKARRKQGCLDDKDLDIGWLHAVFSNYGRARPLPAAQSLPASFVPKKSEANGESFFGTTRIIFNRVTRSRAVDAACWQWAISCRSARLNQARLRVGMSCSYICLCICMPYMSYLYATCMLPVCETIVCSMNVATVWSRLFKISRYYHS